MQDSIKPPILLSRLLTFVLATALVVLGVLCFTVYKMFPLNRPQIFFLTTTLADNQDVKLTEMQTSSSNLDKYKKAFVKEYIRYRNEVRTDSSEMHKKWNAADGVIRTMSTDKVYSDFAKTTLFKDVMSNNLANIPVQCVVSFYGAPMKLNTTDKNTYQTKIVYFCVDNTGRRGKKDYTIRLKLLEQEGVQIRWADRIENPLGLKVDEYTIISENGDPLDTGFLAIE